MLGQHQAGKLVSANKMLFTNKLSILSAENGQLLSLDAGVFKEAQSFFALTFAKKAALAFTVLLIISALVITWLYQRDSLSFSDLPQQQAITMPNGADAFVQEPSAGKEPSAGNEGLATKSMSKPETLAYATNADIYQAIINPQAGASVEKEDKVAQQAQPSDVFNAVVLADNPVIVEQVKVNSEIVAPAKAADNSLAANQGDKVSVASGINPDYFLQAKQGFVIQLAGFSYPSVFKEFIADHQQLEYFGYYRQLNGQKLLVITSRVYDSRDEALQARESLPESVKQRGPWIKSLAAVNNEINAFQSSQ